MFVESSHKRRWVSLSANSWMLLSHFVRQFRRNSRLSLMGWEYLSSPNVRNGSKADISHIEEKAVLQPACCACLIPPTLEPHRIIRLHCLSRPRRPIRSGEWASAKAVTFIVTLAATRSVTLAARASEMSRKSAYALKARDPAFAAAWTAAVNAGAAAPREGDKVVEVRRSPVSPGQGHTSPSRVERERRFARLVAGLRDSRSLAPRPARQ